MSNNKVGVDLVNYIADKNYKYVKAFESNPSFPRLLASIFQRAEQYARIKGVAVDQVTIDGSPLMSPSRKTVRWSFKVKESKS